MTASDQVRLARAYLTRVAEPPAVALTAFVAEHGPEGAVALIKKGAVPPKVASETVARRDLRLAEADLLAAAKIGVRLVAPEDDEWPSWQFAAFALASAYGVPGVLEPLALWVRGEGSLSDLSQRSVSVVGARAATGYGERVAVEFGRGLAERGVTVVSGAAYGVDGAAHRGALTAPGPTIAVVACGLDVQYPAGHTGLLSRIAANGAVVSEYPLGTRPAKHRFLVRNRLIAGLSAGTVVVEAAARSGASNTAATAGALGRVVMAVPGPVTSAMSVGCHAMLRSGAAVPVASVAEVLESAGRIGADLADPVPRPRRDTDDLDPEALRVHQALAKRGRTPHQVAVDAGLPIDRVRALLPTLELSGLAQRGEDGWRRTKAGR